ncbi:hypothetical protein A1F96_07623 [Pyrenophora tritici-repentis]|nr:hypothetical protein A1F95_07933 [Pyrenophora tritici-repentis]PZD26387.1 hypothetical protein A1F96_07623 [Pyrenophora tritici-repentis]
MVPAKAKPRAFGTIQRHRNPRQKSTHLYTSLSSKKLRSILRCNLAQLPTHQPPPTCISIRNHEPADLTLPVARTPEQRSLTTTIQFHDWSPKIQAVRKPKLYNPGVAGLCDLPEELLVNIIKSVEKYDLLNIVRTSKKLRRITEEMVYTRPALDKPYSNYYFPITRRVFCFARTLICRPDLASRVQSLSITTESGYSSEYQNWLPDESLKAFEAIREVGKTHACWATRVKNWIYRLRSGSSHACGGLIIASLPNLKTLTIEVLYKQISGFSPSPWDGSRYERNVMDCLFGRPTEQDTYLDLSELRGLRKIENLEFFGSRLSTNWCILPSLQRLNIARDSFCPSQHSWKVIGDFHTKRSTVRSLYLDVPTYVTYRGEGNLRGTVSPQFISPENFPCLETLSILLTNIDYNGIRDIEILVEPGHGYMDNLISRLVSISASITTLDLEPFGNRGHTFLDYLKPITTLAAFSKLKILNITQDLLLGHDFGLCSNGAPHPASSHPFMLLPGTLRTLSIQHPTTRVFGWLDEFDKDVDSDAFPDFEGILLGCQSIRGDSYPEMYAEWDVWDEQRHRPYYVAVGYRKYDEHPSWYDGTWSKDWDPYVTRVVKFLNNLHVKNDTRGRPVVHRELTRTTSNFYPVLNRRTVDYMILKRALPRFFDSDLSVYPYFEAT